MSSSEATSLEERNKIQIRSFIDEIFNEHNLSSIEKYFGKDSVEGSPQAGQGGEGFRQFLTDFFKAFPDMHTTVEHIVAENNLVMVFLNGSGTHKGKFHGVQPTNKRVNIRSADLYRIENDLITGHWDVVDQLDLFVGNLVISEDRTIVATLSRRRLGPSLIARYNDEMELGVIGSFEKSVQMNDPDHIILFLTPWWVWIN